jgi:hypothetical protein
MRTLFVWLREAAIALVIVLCMLPLLPVAPLPSFHFFARDRIDPSIRRRYGLRLHGPRRALASACITSLRRS